MSALLSGGEVISFHIGACGGNLAAAFWQLISKEHHLVTSEHVARAERELRHQERAQHKFQKQTASRRERGASRRQFTDQFLSNEQPSARERGRRRHLLSSPAPSTRNENHLTTMSQNLHVFFQETLQRYVPRSIFVDQDPAARYSGLFEPLSPLKHFFRPENFIFGNEGSTGVHTGPSTEQNSELLRRTQEALSRELEKADMVQGFQLTHHTGGGTGSSIGSGILHLLRDEIGTKVAVCPVSFLPTITDVGRRHHAVDIYNTILTLPDLAELSDITFLVDNEALYDICFRLVAVQEPGWRDLNHIVASTLANLTACMRFPSSYATTDYASASRLHLKDLPLLLRPLDINSAPFVIPGFAPLTNRAANAPLGALLRSALDDLSDESSTDSRGELKAPQTLRYRRAGTRMPSVAELCQALFRPSHLLTSMDPLGQYYLSSVAVLRGQLTPGEIEQEINYARLHGPSRYHEWSQWMPRKLACKICLEPAVNLGLSAAWAGSSTGIGLVLEKLLKQYDKMLSKRVFTHVFEAAGIEEAQLFEKLHQTQDIVGQYDKGYRFEYERQRDSYEAKRDMGDIPFDWNVNNLPEMVFDMHKAVQLDW